jgi:hypothetical protein
LKRNTFQHIGAAALGIDSGSQNSLVIGNVIQDISGGGIDLGDRGSVNNITVRDNYITGVGHEYEGCIGIEGIHLQNSSTHPVKAALPS